MADKKKEGTPKAAKEFFAKAKKVENLVENTRIVHSDAYRKGLEVIKDEETGEFDHKKLKDVKVQDAFLDKMIDHYLSCAKQRLGLTGLPDDEFDKDIILQKYIGMTKGQLRQRLRTMKSRYTIQLHEKIRDELVGQQEQELSSLRHDHLEEGHIGDILKYVGLDDLVDKENVSTHNMPSLLDMYHHAGKKKLGMDHLAQLVNTEPKKGGWGSDIYLTKKGKDELKKLRDSADD